MMPSNDFFSIPSESLLVIILIVAMMALVTLGAGFATLLYLVRKWRERTWGWCNSKKFNAMTGKVSFEVKHLSSYNYLPRNI